MYATTNKPLATLPYAERAMFAIAISAARNAFSAWDTVPFVRRKAILAGVLNKINDHADELSALLSAEQSITLGCVCKSSM
jgi:acyl-CoA reductase-like NAD-dependent aldehyde dehydrogenase